MQDSSGTLNGQIADDFRIPNYAQNMLYVLTETEAVQAQGKQGTFALHAPSEGLVRLVWGTPDGPPLAFWENSERHNLQWDGRVKVGGFVERLHALEVGGIEVVIIEVIGGVFSADHVGLPSLNDMRHGVFARPSDSEPLGDRQAYPLIILAESNLAGLAQDALVSGLAVDAYGSLANEASSWHELVGLPLLLDSLTLLAP
ncbi:MAG: hypothetical protein ABI947_26065 [Chloroflexota bacterium]